LREGGRASGWDAHKIAAAQRASFRNRLEQHLPALLQESIDVRDATTAWGAWWAGGYALRNALVHEGAGLSPADAAAAWDTMRDLIAHVRRRVNGNSALSPLAEQLSVFQLMYEESVPD
jgi:hypothetical protein